MKQLLILAMLTTLLFSNSIKEFAKQAGYETDYKVAMKKAKKENKDVMFVMVTEFCPWCKRLEELTLSDESVNKEVHKKYIPLILNRAMNKFPQKFDTIRIPSIYFINRKNDNDYKTLVGFQKKNDFLEYLR